MARKPLASVGRKHGHIRKRGNSFQVLVFAGTDPVTGKPNYLTKSTTDEDKVDAIMRDLASQVDEQRHARTRATLGAAMDAWLGVHEAEETPARETRRTPGSTSNRHWARCRSARSTHRCSRSSTRSCVRQIH